ncbi:MAG: sigma-70 family RNA polymerase sigma factor [Kiritimatiellia bacterium]
MNNPPDYASNSPDVEDELDSIAIDRLVAQAAAGDEEAFGQVVQFYYNRIYNVIFRVTRHPEDARELCQAAWVKAWQRLAEYKHEAKFYTWIYRIAVNTALDFLRKRKRRPEVPLEPAIGDDGDHLVLERQRDLAHEETAVDDINRREIREAFARALEGLSPEHRTALVLREVEGMSYEEIAEAMKSRKGTVMSRLFYARRELQKTMGQFL